MHASSATADSSAPGLASRRASTVPVAGRGPDSACGGNVYLRTLLVQGARSTLQSALHADPIHASRLQRWIRQLHARKGYLKTLIAIANKHARMLWAMLVRGERYDADAWQRHPLHPPLPAAPCMTD